MFYFFVIHSFGRSKSIFDDLPSNSKLSSLNTTINFNSLKIVNPKGQFLLGKTNFFSSLTLKNLMVTKSFDSFVISQNPIHIKNAVFSNFLSNVAKLDGVSNQQFTNPQQFSGQNSEFISCTFLNIHSTGGSYIGGALTILNSNVTFRNCQFTGCTSQQGGGAMYVSNDNPASYFTITIESSTFQNNQATGSGSSIYIYKCYNLFVTGSTFSDGDDQPHYISVYGVVNTLFTQCQFQSSTNALANQYVYGYRNQRLQTVDGITPDNIVNAYTIAFDQCCFSSSSLLNMHADSDPGTSGITFNAYFINCSCNGIYTEQSMINDGGAITRDDPSTWFGVDWCIFINPPAPTPDDSSSIDDDSSSQLESDASSGEDSGLFSSDAESSMDQSNEDDSSINEIDSSSEDAISDEGNQTSPSSSDSGSNQEGGNPTNNGNDSNRTGMIVGIVIACVVVVAGCIAALVYFFACKDTRTAFTPGDPDAEETYNFNMDAPAA